MTKEEKKNIETFIEKCKKYDESVEIKRVTVGEESRILDTVCKTLNLIEKLQEENKQLKNAIAVANKLEERIKENFIPKEKIVDIIEKISLYKKLAKESIEQRIVIADSDSLEYGRMQAHNIDMSMLQELLKKIESEE
nr:MAG TPA: hypothetical protein [Caudoviricetes sp.]